jgi:lipid A ethanolaminephosphotransferase
MTTIGTTIAVPTEGELPGTQPQAGVRPGLQAQAQARARDSAPSLTERPGVMIVLASLWLASAGNLPLWRALHGLGVLRGGAGLLFALGLGAGIAAALVLLLAPLAWRGSLKPLLTLLLLTSAASTHFMLAYGIVIDSTMLTNLLQTDLHESADLMSGGLWSTLALLGLAPVAAVWRRPLAWAPWPRRLAANLRLAGISAIMLVAVVFACYQPLASTMRNQPGLRHLVNPLNTLQAAAKLVRHAPAVPHAPAPLGTDAHLVPAGASARPPLLVLVVGETARGDHFGLNGYGRDTTPELAALGVASQRSAWSCGTSTAASVPCMFSPMNREEFDARHGDQETLMDVLQHAGLAVLWLDNQGGCKGVCDRVPNQRTNPEANPALCQDGECLDEAMLDGLDERLAALPADRRARGVVLVLHQMGSHGPAYFKRSGPAEKRFQPECRTATLQDCAAGTLVNAYDNSITETDHFLAGTIRWLQARADRFDPALLYVSDHGESLGEHNLYLHGLPWSLAPDVQKHIAWITWLPPAFQRRSGVPSACLRQRVDERIGHEHLFHSVLGLLDVQTTAYRAERDFYRACRQP